jgi:hypothetical protein
MRELKPLTILWRLSARMIRAMTQGARSGSCYPTHCAKSAQWIGHKAMDGAPGTEFPGRCGLLKCAGFAIGT